MTNIAKPRNKRAGTSVAGSPDRQAELSRGREGRDGRQLSVF